MTFNTKPPGAECSLERNGTPIGQLQTPGGVVVQKTKYDIKVICKKEGYQDATTQLKSEVAGATFGNIVPGGGIGWAIDSASGADSKYQQITTLTLVPAEAAALPAALNVPPTQNVNTRSRLEALQKLRDDNVISEVEYQDRRKRILDAL